MKNDNYEMFDDDAIPIKRRQKSGARPVSSAPRTSAARPAARPASRPTAARPDQSAYRAPAQRSAAPKVTTPRPTEARRAPTVRSARPFKAEPSDSGQIALTRRERMTAVKPKKKVFKKAFLIYIGILLIASAIFLIYVHGLLVDFEASQVNNVVAAKLTSIKNAASKGKIEQEISLETVKSEFSPSSEELSDYQKAFALGDLSYKKTRAGLSSDSEKYEILLNGFKIGSMTLKTVKEDMVLAIFPVTEWKVETCDAEVFSFDFPSSVTISNGNETLTGKPSSTPGLYSYTVSSLFKNGTVITDSVGNNASFNGKDPITFVSYTVKVLSDYKVYCGSTLIDPSHAAVTRMEDYKYVKEYCDDIPDLATYELCLIENGSKISVKDAAGGDVEYKQDGSTIEATAVKKSADAPTGLIGNPDPLEMAETWSLFMSQDLTGKSNGFYKLAPYLIEDSYYYKEMWRYANSIDITFTSTHTLDNPPFSNVEVNDYVKFSDNCFSCHIKFDKPMNLSDGQRIIDTIDSTFYFVYIDDTPDDNTNNPHWAIADRQ